MNRMPKLLITGASGFTGQHACRHFLKSGYAVTGVSRNHISNCQIQVEKCNLTDKKAVRNLVKKVQPQYLLHLAGQNHVGLSWNDPVSTLEANFLSTLYLIDALRHENPNCKTVVVGSALQFEPNDMSTLTHPYSFSKTLQVLAAEAWANLYNLHIVIAKPSNLIGPGLSNGVCSIFAKKIVNMEENKAQNVLEVNNLSAQRDFIDVRDVVSAYEILLTNGKFGEVYEISSGNSHSLKEVITRLKTLTTIDFQIKSQEYNLSEEKVAIPPNKVMKLGWKPTISLQSSLEDILDFYRENNIKGF
ncbi:MAG: NAD-dependent epimerase/dehydratase family protein [Bacillus sp. (in: firmicutes)]